MSRPMRLAGIMSGTSLDAVDVAVVDLIDNGTDLLMEFHGYSTQPFPQPLRQQILDLWTRETVPLATLTALNFELGHAFARAGNRGLIEMGVANVDLLACHGQTIYHLAAPDRRATLQMGEAAVLAREVGVTVAADFRVADIAAGGHGAPLVSYFDSLFFGPGCLVQNIGGIGNVTVLPPAGDAYAFDTGPGNALIDFAARRFTGRPFDSGGALAASGIVDEGFLDQILAHHYFSEPPPKTTGREVFGDQYAASIVSQAEAIGLAAEDIVATLTAATAESIARAYRDFVPPDMYEVILSGGGVENPVLVEMLRRRLDPMVVRRVDEFGITADAKEAVAFALLGYQCVHGCPVRIPPSEGAVLGKIVPGKNYRELMRLLFSSGGSPCPSRRLRLMH